LRVVSWNVHGMIGADRRHDPERIARVIEELRPDVVGLQEVGSPALPAGVPDPAALLGELTGLQSAFGRTMAAWRGGPGTSYGNAVLSRRPFLAIRTYDLSVPGREPRGCVRADVALEGAVVHFFSAHLGLGERERRRQAAQLLSADILRDAALAHPLVLVGDFNSLSDRSAVPRWLRRLLLDCGVAARNRAPTFPSRFPLLRLDRCFVDAAFRVEALEVHRSPLARRASDHLPVVVELVLTPGARRPPPARPLDASGVATRLPGRLPTG
jgi:endonuclease/exonuclease/phosphatase family metal-dependent hydrolase